MHCNGCTVCFSHPLRILRSTIDEWEAPKRFPIEMVPDSTVYTISDWFHVTFGAFFNVTKRIESMFFFISLKDYIMNLQPTLLYKITIPYSYTATGNDTPRSKRL